MVKGADEKMIGDIFSNLKNYITSINMNETKFGLYFYANKFSTEFDKKQLSELLYCRINSINGKPCDIEFFISHSITDRFYFPLPQKKEK
ncbi:MAG: hypothetical protein AABY32_01550 [Nanoarchaeota archaeon]